MAYTLYYWDAPFRGNFVRLTLVEADVDFEEADPTKIYPEKRLDIGFPAMAPPYLYDRKKKKHLSQMPAIVMYLAGKHDLLPKEEFLKNLAAKLIMDCNDVLMEITNFNGLKMWTPNTWSEFRNERLPTWMKIFEKTGRSLGLKKNSGYMLGSKLSAVDLAMAALFGTMKFCLPELADDLNQHAPAVANLCDRVEKRKRIGPYLKSQRDEYGDVYCGGQIEKSIRKMLKEKSSVG